MKFKFNQIVALSAFLVAGCAAYYSVFGLSQLFAGASISIIIMASSLEFGKVVSVSLLQRYWSKLSKMLKVYLSVGVFVLVCITSAGIYGFLSNAYQKTANKFQISQNDIKIFENKKLLFDKSIADNQIVINQKNKRLEQLTNLRTNQESRLDNATSGGARSRARGDISNANTEIQSLNKEIDALNAKNSALMDSSNAYATKAIDANSKSTSTSEIGPLKYLAELTGYPMDKVVNWFILLLIFVFDPLAVALVISFNKIQQLESEKQDNEIVPVVENYSFDKDENDIEDDDDDDDEINNLIDAKEFEYLPEEEIPSQIIDSPEQTKVSPKVIEEPKIIEEPKLEDEIKEEITPKKIELNDIKEVKEINKWGEKLRNNTIERIGTNKFTKDGNPDKIFFKKR
jgi:hypothetical protein